MQSSAVSLVCAIPLISLEFMHGRHLDHTLNSIFISGCLCRWMYVYMQQTTSFKKQDYL